MKTAEELGAAFTMAAESYAAAKANHGHAMVAESKAFLSWSAAAGAHGVASAEEIAAFDGLCAAIEESELAGNLLSVARVALQRARAALPPPPGAARA